MHGSLPKNMSIARPTPLVLHVFSKELTFVITLGPLLNGRRPNRTILVSKGQDQVHNYGGILFHKVDRSRITGNHHQQSGYEIPVEKYCLQIQNLGKHSDRQ